MNKMNYIWSNVSLLWLFFKDSNLTLWNTMFSLYIPSYENNTYVNVVNQGKTIMN